MERLAWGGGPAFLLSVATSQRVYFFSLRRFMLQEAAAFIKATSAASAGAHAALTGSVGPTPPPSHPSAHTATQTRPPRPMVYSAYDSTLPLPSSTWNLVAEYKLPARLLAMDWTHKADGLLLSDESHSVTMVGVEVTGLDSVYVAQVGAQAGVRCTTGSRQCDVV